MSSLNPLALWRRFLALPNDSTAKTIGLALLVATVCSLVVSVTAVTLRPLQEANRLAERVANLLAISDIGNPEPRLVELATGAYASNDPGTSTELPAASDPARLGSREDVATVFEVRDGGELKLLILPVRGSGYQSTLRGYLALEGDLRTVVALTFFEQGETPGMGARIAEDAWQALWPGKQVADDQGAIRIEVVKGRGAGVHEVDGISGATRTGSGITNLLRFWLGPDGYGPYLGRLRAETRR